MEGWKYDSNDDMVDDEYLYQQQIEKEYRLMCDDRLQYIQQLRAENRQLKEALDKSVKGNQRNPNQTS